MQIKVCGVTMKRSEWQELVNEHNRIVLALVDAKVAMAEVKMRVMRTENALHEVMRKIQATASFEDDVAPR